MRHVFIAIVVPVYLCSVQDTFLKTMTDTETLVSKPRLSGEDPYFLFGLESAHLCAIHSAHTKLECTHRVLTHAVLLLSVSPPTVASSE